MYKTRAKLVLQEHYAICFKMLSFSGSFCKIRFKTKIVSKIKKSFLLHNSDPLWPLFTFEIEIRFVNFFVTFILAFK